MARGFLLGLAALALTGGVRGAESGPLVVPFDFSNAIIGLDVTVHGTPLYVMLDTGIDPSVIDLKTAERLHLPIERGDAGEASGFGDGPGAAVFPSRIDELAIATRHFATFDTLASDMSPLSKKLGRPLDGVLGYSFLSDKTVLIDYPRHRFAVLDKPADATALTADCRTHWTTPLTTVDSFPVIPAFRFGNVSGPVSLDTGSSGSIGLFQSGIALPGLRDALEEAGTVTHTGARGDAKSATYRLAVPMGFGPFTLPPGQIVSTYADPGSPETRVANVGNRLFAAMKLRVVLDYRGKTLSFHGDCD